jgi:hypothetical protein
LKNEEKLIGTHSQTQTTHTCNYAPPSCLLMLVEFVRSLFPWQIKQTNKSHLHFMQRISYYPKIHFFKTPPHSQSQKRKKEKRTKRQTSHLKIFSNIIQGFMYIYKIIWWIFPEISKFTWICTKKNSSTIFSKNKCQQNNIICSKSKYRLHWSKCSFFMVPLGMLQEYTTTATRVAHPNVTLTQH